jgi:hypothetical protein
MPATMPEKVEKEKMTTSVRLRLIGWCQRAFDHVSKQPMQYLRGAKAHPQSARNLSNAVIVCINDTRCEGQINNAVNVPSFGDQIHEFNRLAAVANLPSLISKRQLPPGSNYNFVV